jgi:hypothetical protein
MRRRATYDHPLVSVETTRTAPSPFETSLLLTTNAPVSQNRDTALALESPQPLVLARSSFHNEQLRVSSSQCIEEVTTPPAQPETERSKYQPREFNATRRVSSSCSSVPTNRQVVNCWHVYRKKLASLYRSIAFWKPGPVEALYARSVGAPSHQGSTPPSPLRTTRVASTASLGGRRWSLSPMWWCCASPAVPDMHPPIIPLEPLLPDPLQVASRGTHQVPNADTVGQVPSPSSNETLLMIPLCIRLERR